LILLLYMSRIIILTGPSGSGKSSVAKIIAEYRKDTWAFIEQDQIRGYVRSGFKNPADHPWDKAMYDQWSVSIQICSDMARRYKSKNINCVIECFAWANAYGEWHNAFSDLTFELFVLYPNISETLLRNDSRSGKNKLDEGLITVMHKRMAKWHDIPQAKVIDTTNMRIDLTAQLILND
jgi:gluconate kinase